MSPPLKATLQNYPCSVDPLRLAFRVHYGLLGHRSPSNGSVVTGKRNSHVLDCERIITGRCDMRILIAEDDSALAGFVCKGLEAEHYAVDVSGDGEQARALASELDYDLLVLDLNLPRLDGLTILKHVQNKKPSMPVLVLTARGRIEDRVACLDAGADDYLVKPFSFSELSARTARYFVEAEPQWSPCWRLRISSWIAWSAA